MHPEPYSKKWYSQLRLVSRHRLADQESDHSYKHTIYTIWCFIINSWQEIVQKSLRLTKDLSRQKWSQLCDWARHWKKWDFFFFYPLHGKQHHHGEHAFLIYRRNYNHNPPFLVSILNGIILYIIDVAVCLSLHFPFACENVLLSFFEYLIWNKIWRLWSIRKITQFSSAVIAPLLDMEHRDSCPSGPSKYHAAPQLCNT